MTATKQERFLLVYVLLCASLLACLQPYSARVTQKIDIDDLKPDSLAQKRLAREIRKLIGTGYQLGGSDPDGTDCSGLVYIIFKNALNLELPRTTRALARTGRQIRTRSLSFGDLVFFRSERSRRIHHVGIYIEHGQFVHSTTSMGVVISDLDEPYYAHLFMMARRVIVQSLKQGPKS